ncbi:MAG: phosphoribosylformylglycinamidine synthase [Bacteroidetes bacterium HGW-Bacteroidetes-21]|jgi:phosphoribosylformylglycinamidine synthase|nr:MAG: phosphoribosylformylglycinamidine synthase [Bacteroidetes bacterium HGW-Bacteroidetes-21]
MKFSAAIDVMPQKALLDPQGKAVCQSLQKIGHESVSAVRMGKHIQLELDAENEEAAKKTVDEICRKVLINPIMENYSFVLKKAE